MEKTAIIFSSLPKADGYFNKLQISYPAKPAEQTTETFYYVKEGIIYSKFLETTGGDIVEQSMPEPVDAEFLIKRLGHLEQGQTLTLCGNAPGLMLQLITPKAA